MGSRVHDWLERARDAAEAGDLQQTRAALKESFSRAPRDPDVWTVGGSCLLRAGSAEDALGCADRALEWDDSHAPAHHLRFEARWSLGNPHGGLDAARKALSLRPDAHAWRAQVVEHLLSTGDALQAWGIASQNPDMSGASDEALIGAMRAAARCLEGEVVPIAAALVEASETHRQEAWRALIEVGALEEAAALAEAATDPGVRHELLARMALFSLDRESAHAHVVGLMEAGRSADADLHRGALAVLEEDWETAISCLDRVLVERPHHGEAHCWRSEALRGQGFPREAREAAQKACNASHGRHLAGEINQMLARIEMEGWEGDAVLDPGAIAPLVHALLPLAPDFTIAWEGRVKVVRALLEHGLARMGGNRTLTPTTVSEETPGAWERFRPGDAPTDLARQRQQALWTQDPQRVLETLDECARQHGKDSGVRVIAGDTALWLGENERAVRHFQEALRGDPDCFDAQVGLAAAAVLKGEEEIPVSTLRALGSGDSASPAQQLWSAEALRRAGEREEALVLLRDVMAQFGPYPAAWLNRGLIQDSREAFLELHRLVPVFVRDACRHQAIRLESAKTDPDAARKVLEAGLAMVRGNRVGEVLTWFVGEGGMRISAWRPERSS